MDSLFDREQRDTASEAPPAAPRSKPRSGFRWIPIRKLTARHRPRMESHLRALSERDRYLRFGYAASDAQIARYVEQLDFERDEVFGIFNWQLQLIALAHLAYMAPQPPTRLFARNVRCPCRCLDIRHRPDRWWRSAWLPQL